jgi:2,3,4,5-tetrahydropyridine-2-carboxylate N-succinyltransferase
VLTRGTPVYDLVRGEVYKATAEMPLVIPEGGRGGSGLQGCK